MKTNDYIYKRFKHQQIIEDDPLYIVNFFGSKIFENKFSKIILLSLLVLYSIVLTVQIVYFSLHSDTKLLIHYGPLCLQLSWCQLNIIILLLHQQMINKIMNFVKLWDIDSAGNETKVKIIEEIKRVKMFVMVTTTDSLLWATTCFFSDEYREYHIWGLLYKLTVYLSTFPMLSCGYKAVYVAKNMKFQMYIFAKLAEDITFGFNKSNVDLIYDQRYQKEIEFRLKVLIKRHIELLRWKNHTLKVMNYLILPFSLGGIFIFSSIMLYFFQLTEGFKIISIFRTIFAVIGANSIFWGFITSGQNLEDESQKMYLAMTSVKWYTWNASNRKLLHIIMCNLAKPMTINHKEVYAVNYKLALQIFKSVYTAISFIYRTW